VDVFIVQIVQIVQKQALAVMFHVVRISLQEPVVCGLVAGVRVHTQIISQYTHHRFLQTKPNHMKHHCQTLPLHNLHYKDNRNLNHAQCNFLMMDTQYPQHVGEEITTVCFMF
jgi:hypothetical protein